MDKQPHPYPRNVRVKLLDTPSNLYPMAPSGSEGWARKLDHDPLGYPLVFIEWDKEHWAYNGEADAWTFASHFEAMEEKVDREEVDPEALAQIFSILNKKVEPSSVEGKPGADVLLDALVQHIEWPTKEDLKTALAQALTDTADDDGFVLLSIKRNDDGTFIPSISMCVTDLEAKVLLDAQLSAIAAEFHASVANQFATVVADYKERNASTG